MQPSVLPRDPTVPGLLAMADRCVMCGLCLPHCPSYRVTGEEGESPRGRIALAKALIQGRLQDPGPAFGHLDRCLSCGSCEVVCPADVPFLALLDGTRRLQRVVQPEPGHRRWVRWILRSPQLVRISVRIARVLRRLGLARALRSISDVAAELAAVGFGTQMHRSGRSLGAASGSGKRGEAVVFQGCVGAALDTDTLDAAAQVLSRLGYGVRVPARSHCCGALARHVGASAEADRLASAARDAMGAFPGARIVGVASGCQSALANDVARPLLRDVDDIMGLLAADAGLDQFPMRALPRHAAVLVPCTHAVAGPEAIRRVLGRVPQLRMTFLPEMPRCCGAAGTYFADQPRVARALRAERIEQLRQLAPDVVLTTNIGCRLYVQAGLHDAGLTLPVMHPVTLLAESLAP
jgi:glycolate oxidase iron-sulfur subunit